MLDKYAAAVITVVAAGRGSTSLVQRILKIGYNSAARLIERMERDAILSAPNRAGARTVLCQHVRGLPINVEWDETGPEDEIELLYREERQQHAIAALEHALDDARKGDLTGFAFAAIGRPGANQVAMAYSFDETDPATLHEMVDATRTLLVEIARGGK